MKRRSRVGGKPAKARRRRVLKPKHHRTPKAMPRRGSVPAGQETEVARLTRERERSEARVVLEMAHASPWLIGGRWRSSGRRRRLQQQIVTFDFKVNTGSASRRQSLGLRS